MSRILAVNIDMIMSPTSSVMNEEEKQKTTLSGRTLRNYVC